MSASDLQELVKTVDELHGRVEDALDLAAIIKVGGAPAKTPIAYIVPLGFNAKRASVSTGAYVQAVEDGYGVVLVHRKPGDITGKRIAEELEPLVDAVIKKVCGRVANNGFGVWSVKSGRLLGLQAGTATYQLTFSIQSEVRINS